VDSSKLSLAEPCEEKLSQQFLIASLGATSGDKIVQFI
jgi:hypothetical protein